MAGRSLARTTGAALGALLLAACGEPIVPRSPEALYALAKEQMANANYSPALNTLARAARAGPESEAARRALVLRFALLSGMARGFKAVGESYLTGSEQAGAAAYAAEMRAVAMDYFGRARGRSLEMVEALDHLVREPPTHPLYVDYPWPQAAGDTPALVKVRQGQPLEVKERNRAEREQVLRGLAGMLVRLSGAEGDPAALRSRFQGSAVELAPAAFYLGAARELIELSSIYGPEALKDRRLYRLYHERALAAAGRAAQLAGTPGDARLREESQRLEDHCREVLKKP